MNFLFTASSAFCKPVATLIYSISKNSSPNEGNFFYLPYIENENPSKLDVDYLKKYIRNNDEIIQFPVPGNCIIPVEARWTYLIWLKYTCLFFLPKQIDRLLYIDSDCIVDSDLTTLFNHHMSCPVLGVKEELDNNVGLKRLGLPLDNIYVNTGVLLINPKAFVDEFKNIDNFLHICTNVPYEPLFYDQDFTNYHYHSVMQPIEGKKYMFFTLWYDYDDNEEIIIFHYAGNVKPWVIYNYSYSIKVFKRYWKYGKKTFGFRKYISIRTKAVARRFKDFIKRKIK